jgi:hypothetical protein
MVLTKTCVITAEVDREIVQWLEKSKNKGISKTYNINQALKEYIAKKSASKN